MPITLSFEKTRSRHPRRTVSQTTRLRSLPQGKDPRKSKASSATVSLSHLFISGQHSSWLSCLLHDNILYKAVSYNFILIQVEVNLVFKRVKLANSLKRTVRKKGRFLYRAYPNLHPAQKIYTFLHTMYPNKCTFLVLGVNSDTVLLREKRLAFSHQQERYSQYVSKCIQAINQSCNIVYNFFKPRHSQTYFRQQCQ